jgi:hypothetical protein
VRKKAARNFVWTTVETTMPGTSGGESLSLSISFLGWWKKTYKKKIMCVCVCVCEREREREREREILRDSKGKIAMGREKTEQNKTKFNLRSRIKQRNNAGSSGSSPSIRRLLLLLLRQGRRERLLA